jgi:DNA-binding XRE family transcriptional regulator
VPTADLVKTARSKLGMTQAELAAALGRSRKTIVRWEAGVSEPKHSDIERLLELAATVDPARRQPTGKPKRA